MHIFIDKSDLREFVVGSTVPYVTNNWHELISSGYIYIFLIPNVCS